jgi:gliding motility-associated-like protein
MGDGSLAAFADSAINCYNTSGIFDIGLTVTYSNGCSTTLIKNDLIEIFPRAVADFTTNANDVDALDPTVMFTNLSSNATSFNWNFGDLTSSTTMHPNHIYQQEGTYLTTLIANNQYGCRDTISKLVEIKPIFTFYAPNAFSPNDDSSNEKFLPLGTGWDIKTFKMYIFDRWGNLCYSTTDHDAGWDGKANGGSNTAQIDSYVWKVTLSDVFGTKHNYHGIVNIVK